MSMRTQLAYVAAVVTLLYGLFGLIFPVGSLHLLGLQLTDPRGVGVGRATLGGLFIMLGFLMLWALPTRPHPRSHVWLRMAGYLWLAVAGGRLVSLVFDGVTLLGVVFFVVEALLGLAALGAGLERRRSRTADGAGRY
jgi:hypothetical protein